MASKFVPLPSPFRLSWRAVYRSAFSGVVMPSGRTPMTVYGSPLSRMDWPTRLRV